MCIMYLRLKETKKEKQMSKLDYELSPTTDSRLLAVDEILVN